MQRVCLYAIERKRNQRLLEEKTADLQAKMAELTAGLVANPHTDDLIGHQTNVETLIQKLNEEDCISASLDCYDCVLKYPKCAEIALTVELENRDPIFLTMDVLLPEDGELSFVEIHEVSNDFHYSDEELCKALFENDKDEIGIIMEGLTQNLLPNPDSSDPILGHFENHHTLIRLLDEVACLEAWDICYACIETLPYQSEIRLVIHHNGQVLEKTMDVNTPKDGPLEFWRLHN